MSEWFKGAGVRPSNLGRVVVKERARSKEWLERSLWRCNMGRPKLDVTVVWFAERQKQIKQNNMFEKSECQLYFRRDSKRENTC